MKEQIKTVYTCDHCNRRMFVKPAAIKHEIACKSNPDNWTACTGCKHLKEIEEKEVLDENHYIGRKTVRAFYCNAKNIELYPIKCVHKGLLTKYPQSFKGALLMPKKCELRETPEFPF